MKILAVDDNATNLEIIKVLLRTTGFPVLAAASGEAAVEVALRERPALIFMDLSMPGAIDGLEATRRIKARLTPAPVVIALTAMVMEGDEKQALAAGCDGFIRKPYTRRELLALMAEHCPELSVKLPMVVR